MKHATAKNLIGTTFGLSGSTDGDANYEERPEQVYVYRMDDDRRPIRISGRTGYGGGPTLDLTLDQVRELRAVLMEALDEPEPTVTLFRVPTTTIDSVCPLIPEGASEWESQEIQRAWRAAHIRALEAVGDIVHGLTRPAAQHGAIGADRAVREMDREMTLLAARIDGVVHRKALAEKEAGA